MVIETVVFRAADGIDEGDLLALDASYQEAVAYQSPGLLRRTVARGDDGEWLEVLLWSDDSPRTMSGDADVRARWVSATSISSRRTWRGL